MVSGLNYKNRAYPLVWKKTCIKLLRFIISPVIVYLSL